MAKFISSWNEDESKGSKLLRRIVRWLVNQNIWNFYDFLVEFNTLEQVIRWRFKIFSALPLPNVIYQDMLSDKAMTELAFANCISHYTRRIEDTWQPGYGIPDEKFLEDVVYVNDMTSSQTIYISYTVSVNYQAAISLVNERRLVQRIWPFDYDLHAFWKIIQNYVINSFQNKL